MLDLAVQFARFLDEPRPSPNFGDVEGLFSIGLWDTDHGVDAVTPVGVVSGLTSGEVVQVLKEFLSRLVNEIMERGPELLDWASLAPLPRFA